MKTAKRAFIVGTIITVGLGLIALIGCQLVELLFGHWPGWIVQTVAIVALAVFALMQTQRLRVLYSYIKKLKREKQIYRSGAVDLAQILFESCRNAAGAVRHMRLEDSRRMTDMADDLVVWSLTRASTAKIPRHWDGLQPTDFLELFMASNGLKASVLYRIYSLMGNAEHRPDVDQELLGRWLAAIREYLVRIELAHGPGTGALEGMSADLVLSTRDSEVLVTEGEITPAGEKLIQR